MLCDETKVAESTGGITIGAQGADAVLELPASRHELHKKTENFVRF